MEPLLKLPWIILSQYASAIRKNYGTESPPLSDSILFWWVPLALGITFGFCFSESPSKDIIQNLITVHGIFLTVLIASYVPFLDHVEEAKVNSHGVLDTKAELDEARRIVKGLLFALNSFAVVISLVVVVLLCFMPWIQEIPDRELLSLFSGKLVIRMAFLLSLYKSLLYYSIILNCMNVFRIIQVMNSIVAPKIL